MGLKRKFNLTARVIDQGERIDSFSTKTLLGNVIASKAVEGLEERSDNTKHNIDTDFSKVIDILAIAVKKNDLAQRSKMRIIHNGCFVQGEVVAFQPNNADVVEARTNNASTSSHEYMNFIVSGDL